MSPSLMLLNAIPVLTVSKCVSLRPLSWTPEPHICCPLDIPTWMSKTHPTLNMCNCTFLIFLPKTTPLMTFSISVDCNSIHPVKPKNMSSFITVFLLSSSSNLTRNSTVFNVRIYPESYPVHLLCFYYLSQSCCHLSTGSPQKSPNWPPCLQLSISYSQQWSF